MVNRVFDMLRLALRFIARVSIKFSHLSLVSCSLVEPWLSLGLFLTDSGSKTLLLLISICRLHVSEESITSFIVMIKIRSSGSFDNWVSKHIAVPFVFGTGHSLSIVDLAISFLEGSLIISEHVGAGESV